MKKRKIYFTLNVLSKLERAVKNKYNEYCSHSQAATFNMISQVLTYSNSRYPIERLN